MEVHVILNYSPAIPCFLDSAFLHRPVLHLRVSCINDSNNWFCVQTKKNWSFTCFNKVHNLHYMFYRWIPQRPILLANLKRTWDENQNIFLRIYNNLLFTKHWTAFILSFRDQLKWMVCLCSGKFRASVMMFPNQKGFASVIYQHIWKSFLVEGSIIYCNLTPPRKPSTKSNIHFWTYPWHILCYAMNFLMILKYTKIP